VILPTVPDYGKAWHHAQESTSSSLSKIHFGYYIVVCEDPELKEMGALLVAIPLLMGTTPKQWQQSINVLLEKVAGVNQVDKLLIIHLFEADFNVNNK